MKESSAGVRQAFCPANSQPRQVLSRAWPTLGCRQSWWKFTLQNRQRDNTPHFVLTKTPHSGYLTLGKQRVAGSNSDK